MKPLTILILLLAATQVCYGQELVAPTFGSVRAFSMGGAYTASNSGFNALLGNPGGLALLNNAQFVGGGRFILMGTADLEEEYYEEVDGLTDFSSKFGVHPKLGHAGFAFPIAMSGFADKLVGAVGYRNVYDVSEKYIYEGEDEFGYEGKVTETTSGFLNTLSIGLGALISETVALGASVNIPVVKGYNYLEETEVTSSGITTTEEYERERDLSGGMFIQLGGIVQVTPELALGGSYTLAHEFEFEDGTYTLKENGTLISEGDIGDDKIEIPGMFSLGLSYRASETLLLSAEVQNRPWEDVEIDGNDLDYLESGSSYRIGFEYGDSFLLRGGFISERAPMTDVDGDPVNFTAVTGGFGFSSDAMRFDVGGMYAFTKFEVSRNLGANYDYIFNQLIAFASLTYFFDFGLGY